jgi:hypothetical protein
MKAHVLTGSKREIVEALAKFEGDIREAIVFFEEPCTPVQSSGDIFAEMEPYMVPYSDVDDTRAAIYNRMEGE